MSWVAVGLAVVAAAGTAYNNQQVANKQDSTLAASLRQQQMLQQQQNAKTNQLVQKVAASSPAKAKADLLGQFTAAMQQNKGRSTADLNQAGNVSSAYTKAADDAAGGIANYGNQQSDLLSSIDAPGLQRQQEAEGLQQYATGLNATKMQSASDQFLAQMKLNQIRTNPWITGVTSAMSAYAKANAGSGGYGGNTTPNGYSGTADMGGGLTVNLPDYGTY